MSTSEDIKAQRGTKRTCQNEECGARFYDLNRDPIICSICGTVYELEPAAPPVAQRAQRPPVKQPIVERPAPEEPPSVEGEELVAVEGVEEPVAADEDETFLEEEEEPSDVSGIIDAPIEDADEKT
jgi:uncharacterized protein (TIGR02300 family)